MTKLVPVKLLPGHEFISSQENETFSGEISFCLCKQDKTVGRIERLYKYLEGCQHTSLHHQGLSLLQAGPDHLNGINFPLRNV